MGMRCQDFFILKTVKICDVLVIYAYIERGYATQVASLSQGKHTLTDKNVHNNGQFLDPHILHVFRLCDEIRSTLHAHRVSTNSKQKC